MGSIGSLIGFISGFQKLKGRLADILQIGENAIRWNAARPGDVVWFDLDDNSPIQFPAGPHRARLVGYEDEEGKPARVGLLVMPKKGKRGGGGG